MSARCSLGRCSPFSPRLPGPAGAGGDGPPERSDASAGCRTPASARRRWPPPSLGLRSPPSRRPGCPAPCRDWPTGPPPGRRVRQATGRAVGSIGALHPSARAILSWRADYIVAGRRWRVRNGQVIGTPGSTSRRVRPWSTASGPWPRRRPGPGRAPNWAGLEASSTWRRPGTGTRFWWRPPTVSGRSW